MHSQKKRHFDCFWYVRFLGWFEKYISYEVLLSANILKRELALRRMKLGCSYIFTILAVISAAAMGGKLVS